MSSSPTLIQWITAFALLVLFSWVLLGMFWDVVPLPKVSSDHLHNQIWGYSLLVVIGLCHFFLARPVLDWVWMGLRHILGMDLVGE